MDSNEVRILPLVRLGSDVDEENCSAEQRGTNPYLWLGMPDSSGARTGRGGKDRVVFWTGRKRGKARMAGSGIQLGAVARRMVKVRSGKYRK